ncbi:MAG TPA: hypothetical protein VGB45_04885 [Abditibacterium sp.]|jgi:hypothetical protein
MVLPNLAFDALMFGLLLLAAGLDSVFPILHGTASLLIVGGATYWAAQELSDALLRRAGWTQESLATSLALCSGGFLYYLARNDSDLALLGLSVGLMMGALMVAISVMAALGAAFKEGRVTPLLGWLITAVASLALGLAAGFSAILLGLDSPSLLPLKIGAIFGALVLWKLREKLAPPELNPHASVSYAPEEIAANSQSAAPAPVYAPRVALFPKRGTLLDRLFPLIVLGTILCSVAQRDANISLPANAPVAVSETGEAQ